MSRLSVSVLGPLLVTRDTTPLSGFAYDKVRALLAYLVIEADRPWRRETLAALFWPDQDERAARHSLSQALWSLRRALDDRDTGEPLLLITSDTVQLNPVAGIEVDLHTFTALLDACEVHPHRDADRCRACARRLETAAALYRGDLLDGFSLPDSVAFDEWLLVRREQERERALAALRRLADFLEARGAWGQAATCARRLIALDPWREDAVRQLMRLLAWTGQRPAAIEQFSRLRQRLDEELGVEPEMETTRLLDRIRQGVEIAPANPEPFARRHVIPEQITGFVGRERELAELSGLLLDGTCRLITLTGPGGIGKTRLAIEAARICGESFADGVVFVPLAGLTSPALLASAIGRQLDAPLHGSYDEREALLRWLAEREMLLVLDNAEHLLDGVGLLAELLERSPEMQVLVTSRERLDLHGEWVVELGGLSLPAGRAGVELSGAESLFLQRAAQARTGFTPTQHERAAIARLCMLTEGMPLALEIAAGWLPALSCAEIVAEIERSLGFLATTRRDVEHRHRSIQAVFDQSWNLLDAVEQRAFRRLAVFRGGFQRDAAERVTGATLPVLSALVSKSLLRRTSEGRYEMHELLRQYAAARLQERDDEAYAARGLHSEYYMRLLAGRTADLRGSQQNDALAELNVEIENLRAAWSAAIADGRTDALAGAAYGLWLFMEITCRNHEFQSLMQQGVDLLASDSDSEDNDPHRALARGRMLVPLGGDHIRTGGYARGETFIRQGLQLVRELGEPDDIALALNFMAVFAHARHDLDQEEALLRESVAWSAKATDQWPLPYSLNDLGTVMLLRGDVAEATRLHRESLALFQQGGDARGVAFALHNLGVVASRTGEYAEAEEIFLQALEIRRNQHYVWGVAATLAELGIVARETGRPDLATERFSNALRVATDIHAVQTVMQVLAEWAALLITEGQHERARRMLATIVQHPDGEFYTRDRAIELLATLGDPAVTTLHLHDGTVDHLDAAIREFLGRSEREYAVDA